MIRVLQIVPTLGYGGVARVVRNYYESLDRNSFHFDFVTHGGKEDYHEELMRQGCRVFYFQTLGKLGIKKYKSQIISNIDLNQYDIVHVHTGLIMGIYAKCYKGCGAKKIICHAHTTKALSWKQKVLEPLFRYAANKYSDLALACGPKAGTYCFGKGKFTVIPNGIDYDRFNDVSDYEVAKTRYELGISSSSFVVGHVGLFAPVKNHTFLIQVAKAFTNKFPDTVFVMCGGGPCLDSIKEDAFQAGLKSNVIFTGVRNDVNVLLRLFDVFVLPSLHEGLPVVGIESQAVGLQCLLSDRIDRSVDIGCNLCSFLAIDNGVEPWIKALTYARQKRQKLDKYKIKQALIEHDYEISRTCEILTTSYGRLLQLSESGKK